MNTLNIESTEYVLPACWASYLINGDASGLEDGEQAVVDAFLVTIPGWYCVDCGESCFSWRNDAASLGGDVCEYTFLRNS